MYIVVAIVILRLNNYITILILKSENKGNKICRANIEIACVSIIIFKIKTKYFNTIKWSFIRGQQVFVLTSRIRQTKINGFLFIDGKYLLLDERVPYASL